MTNEEALTIVRAAFKALAVKQTDGIKEFVENAKDRYDLALMLTALEKQIPKEHRVDALGDMFCPVCGECIEYPADSYCKHCGQAID